VEGTNGLKPKIPIESIPITDPAKSFLHTQNRINLRAPPRVDDNSDGARIPAEVQKDANESVVLEALLFVLDCLDVHSEVVVRRAAEVDQGDEAGEGGNGD
jgi:hypothetical protein